MVVMNKTISYIIALLLGAVIGAYLCREHHFRDATKMPQSDTTFVYDTVRYSRLELATSSYRLKIPKVASTELVFIPEDSVTVIYRDSVRYVTLPREYFFTETDDVQVWHSGIDSRIDSLNVFRESRVVREVITQCVTKRHSLGIGIEANYSTAFCVPVQLEYSYSVLPWMSVYGYAEYELLREQFGVGVGTMIQIGW